MLVDVCINNTASEAAYVNLGPAVYAIITVVGTNRPTSSKSPRLVI